MNYWNPLFMKNLIDFCSVSRVATGGTGPESVLIKNFQLRFIRPNDPIVTDDRCQVLPIP